MTISSPTKTNADTERFLECQNVLESQLLAMVNDAVDAGWLKAEVLAAIQEITDNTALAGGQDVALSVKIRKFNLTKQTS